MRRGGEGGTWIHRCAHTETQIVSSIHVMLYTKIRGICTTLNYFSVRQDPGKAYKSKFYKNTHSVSVGLLNPVTVGLLIQSLWGSVGLNETHCTSGLNALGHSGAKRVPLLPYPVMVGLGGSKRDPRVPHPVTVGLLHLRRDAVAPPRHWSIQSQ